MVALTPRVNIALKETDIDIRWADPKLEEACTDETAGRRRFGVADFKALQLRLVDLIAAPTLDVMRSLPGKCHQLTGDRAGQFALHLGKRRRLVFQPDHDPLPISGGGDVDISAVSRIEILEVVDYHGH